MYGSIKQRLDKYGISLPAECEAEIIGVIHGYLGVKCSLRRDCAELKQEAATNAALREEVEGLKARLAAFGNGPSEEHLKAACDEYMPYCGERRSVASAVLGAPVEGYVAVKREDLKKEIIHYTRGREHWSCRICENEDSHALDCWIGNALKAEA